MNYSKTCRKRPLKKNTKIGFQYELSLNAGQMYCRMLPLEHSAILSTFIKLPFTIKTLVMSIFKWLLKTPLLYFINVHFYEEMFGKNMIIFKQFLCNFQNFVAMTIVIMFKSEFTLIIS